MGMKYMINAFRYPYPYGESASKQTRWFIVAAFWFVVYAVKYDGVSMDLRKDK